MFENAHILLCACDCTIEAYVCSHPVEHLDNDELTELIAWCQSGCPSNSNDPILNSILAWLPGDFTITIEQLGDADSTWKLQNVLICNP